MPRVLRPAAPLPAASLLQLIWLASPALPVGGFSYSEGLEPAVEAGKVTTEAQAQAWLLDQLALGLARSDLPAAARAFAACRRGDLTRAAEIDAWVHSTRETHELRGQAEQMGRSLVEWLKNHRGDAAGLRDFMTALPSPTWPVAFAFAAAQTGAPVREAMLAFAFGWAENMVQAAIKCVPLGQASGQRILAALAEAIPEEVDHAIALPDGERQAFTPMLAIRSAQHESQYSRLFRS
jgi:urease accessory protein